MLDRRLINSDFARLWLGQSVSMVGSQVTLLAVPLTALLVLHASPAQLGVLSALQYAPIVLITLPAGVLVDRLSPRRIMLVTDGGRALVYGTVGILAAAGVLSLTQLAALAFAGGVLTAIFDVAYISYLPEIVSRDALVEANARLEASSSAAEVGGQGLGGVLVQIAGVPGALLFDAVSYVVSAAAVLGVRRGRPTHGDARQRTTLATTLQEVRVGMAVTFGSERVRPLMLQTAWLNLLLEMSAVAVPIYVIHVLGLSSAVLGAVLGAGSAGAVAGCASASRLGRRHGTVAAIVLGMALACCGQALLPLAQRPGAVAALALAYSVHGFGLGVFNVHSVSLRQREIPGNMLARVVASYRLVTWGGIPIGALLGGAVVEALGPRPALALVAAGLSAGALAFAVAMVARRPARAVR